MNRMPRLAAISSLLLLAGTTLGQPAQPMLTPVPAPTGQSGQPVPMTPQPPAPKMTAEAAKFEGDAAAGLQFKRPLAKGDVIAGDIVIDQRYAVAYIPPEKPGSERLMKLSAGVVLTVTDVTPQQTLVDLTYDKLTISVTPATGEAYTADTTSAAPPAPGTPARAFYDACKQMTATKLKLTLVPDNTIQDLKGNEELMRLGPARLMRRLLEADGVRAVVTPLIALRATTPLMQEGTPPVMVPNGQWPNYVVILADRGRQGGIELRKIDKTDGDAATVSGTYRQGGPGGAVAPGAFYLRDASIDSKFTWDTKARRLLTGKVDDAMTLILTMPDNSRQSMSTLTTTTITPRAGK